MDLAPARVVFLTAVTLSVIGVRSAAAQQGRAALAIVSPADGTVVAPGDTLTVSVASPANRKFESVVLAAEVIGIAGMATMLPARFTVTIPADAKCAKQQLNALALGPSGQETKASIAIDVEETDVHLIPVLPKLMGAGR
jgi:hypothetical protein